MTVAPISPTANRVSISVIIMAIMVGLMAACSPPRTASPAPITPPVSKPEITLKIASVGLQPLFDKSSLIVPAGSRITLEFTNSTPRGERTMQNWVLVEPGSEDGVVRDAPYESLSTDFIKPGDKRVIAFTTAIVGSQIAVVTFDAPPPGRYTYLSTTPRHHEMRGVLLVQ